MVDALSLRQLSTTRASNAALNGINITGTGFVRQADDTFREIGGQVAEYIVEMSYPTIGGSADVLTLTPTTALAALASNVVYTGKAASSNATTTPTLQVSSTTAKVIRKIVGGADVALAVGDIQTGGRYDFVYDATANSSGGAWILKNHVPTRFHVAIAPVTSDGAALGTTALQWSDVFLASGGVVNWNNGAVALTHFSNSLLVTASTALSPFSNDSSALGTTSNSWSDLCLASGAVINFNNSDVTMTHSSDALAFAGAATNGYSFDSSIIVDGSTGASVGRLRMGSMGNSAIGWAVAASTVGGTKAASFIATGGSEVGSISQTNTATTFATSSDKRLKENFREFDSAQFIDQLQVGAFEWKADGTTSYGVLAQDAYEVFPDMIVPPRVEDGTWAADYSKLVPILLREVQMLRARVTALEA